MIKMLFTMTLATMVVAAITHGTPKGRLPLHGLVVVIDPGHGGMDPGAHGVFRGIDVYENEYTFDVGKRLEREVRKLGGLPFLTTYDADKSANVARDWPPSRVFPDKKTEHFTWDHSLVQAKTVGLKKRLAYAT